VADQPDDLRSVAHRQRIRVFYGFMAADQQYYRRSEGTRPIEPKNPEKATTSRDMTDKASIGCPEKALMPTSLLCIFCSWGDPRPHHVLRMVSKYKGKFDQGWDSCRRNLAARSSWGDPSEQSEVRHRDPAGTIPVPMRHTSARWKSTPASSSTRLPRRRLIDALEDLNPR